jgi:hypothetical protein
LFVRIVERASLPGGRAGREEAAKLTSVTRRTAGGFPPPTAAEERQHCRHAAVVVLAVGQPNFSCVLRVTVRLIALRPSDRGYEGRAGAALTGEPR